MYIYIYSVCIYPMCMCIYIYTHPYYIPTISATQPSIPALPPAGASFEGLVDQRGQPRWEELGGIRHHPIAHVSGQKRWGKVRPVTKKCCFVMVHRIWDINGHYSVIYIYIFIYIYGYVHRYWTGKMWASTEVSAANTANFGIILVVLVGSWYQAAKRQ